MNIALAAGPHRSSYPTSTSGGPLKKKLPTPTKPPPPLFFNEIRSLKDLSRYTFENSGTIKATGVGLLIGLAASSLFISSLKPDPISRHTFESNFSNNTASNITKNTSYCSVQNSSSSFKQSLPKILRESKRLFKKAAEKSVPKRVTLPFFRSCDSAKFLVVDFDRVVNGQAEPILNNHLSLYPTETKDTIELFRRSFFHIVKHTLTTQFDTSQFPRLGPDYVSGLNYLFWPLITYNSYQEMPGKFRAHYLVELISSKVVKLESLVFYYKQVFHADESQLPSCTDKNSDVPLHRERFVVCQQATDFFASKIAEILLNRCYKVSDIWTRFATQAQDFGSFLVAQENHGTQTYPFTSSWTLRARWDKEHKESYCKNSKHHSWKSQYCQAKNLSEEQLSGKNVQNFKKEIFSKTKRSVDTYSTLVYREIEQELQKRSQISKASLKVARSLINKTKIGGLS